MEPRIVETRNDPVLLNQAAFLLIDYFTHKAGGKDKVLLTDWKRLSDIIESTHKGISRTFLLFEDDEAVGIGGISRHGESEYLFVKPEHRGKGYATMLVNHRFNNGAWFTTIRQHNTASLKLMHKVGLVEFYRYEDLVVMSKPRKVEDFGE